MWKSVWHENTESYSKTWLDVHLGYEISSEKIVNNNFITNSMESAPQYRINREESHFVDY